MQEQSWVSWVTPKKCKKEDKNGKKKIWKHITYFCKLTHL